MSLSRTARRWRPRRTLIACSLAVYALSALATAVCGQALRDPTRPPQAASVSRSFAEPAPVLSAVLDFGGTRSAIFNGRLVHGGSTVGAYIIDEVLADGVRYRRAGTVHELHLPHPATSVKQPAAEPAGAPAAALAAAPANESATAPATAPAAAPAIAPNGVEP